MTRPASELQWSPDAVSGSGVWLLWFGAPWNYRVDWGDGTSSEQGYWSSAVKHTYDQPGTYTVTCTPDLPDGVPVRCQVTARSFRTPPTPGSAVVGNVVTLTMADVPDPVRWRIQWGDGETSEHTGRAAEHTYPWDFGAPEITVTDAPSRRAVAFTGPEVGPQPPPSPAGYQGFCFEFLENAGGRRRFALHGGGMPAGEKVTFYHSTRQDWFRTLTANSKGEVHDTVDIDIPYGDKDMWWSYAVSSPTHGLVFVPLRAPAFERGDPQVTYQLSEGDTRTLTFSAWPPLAGEYHVDYGDGGSERLTVDHVPMLTSHRYSGSGTSYTVTITFPDGRTATREIVGSNPCPPCYNANYPGSCTVGWYITGGACGACGQNGGEHFSPVEIRDHYHAAARIHLPDNPGENGWHNVYGFGGFTPGEYTFDYRTALVAPWSHVVNIDARGTRRYRRTIELFPLDGQQLTPQFQLGQTWDGGYSGEFVVTNDGEEASGPWLLEFELPPDARAAEVWPSDQHQLVSLGGGRWRVSCDTPIPASTTARVGARVEPSGKARSHPNNVIAREKTSE